MKGKREVQREFAESTAAIDWGHGYIEASAKDDTNIIGIFKELLKQANFHITSGIQLARVGKKLDNPLSLKNGKSKQKPKLTRTKSCVMS